MVMGANEQGKFRAGLGDIDYLIFFAAAVVTRHTGVRDTNDDIRAFGLQLFDALAEYRYLIDEMYPCIV